MASKKSPPPHVLCRLLLLIWVPYLTFEVCGPLKDSLMVFFTPKSSRTYPQLIVSISFGADLWIKTPKLDNSNDDVSFHRVRVSERRGDPDLVASLSLPPSQSAVNLGAVAPIRESVKDWATERPSEREVMNPSLTPKERPSRRRPMMPTMGSLIAAL